LGDFIAVLDGRAALVDEIRLCASELRSYLAQRAQELNNTAAFTQSIDGHLAPDMVSQLRVPLVKRTLLAIAALG
jgi:hypothetical protein